MASRVETKPKTAPRWKTEGDNYKPDLKKYPEEITDLCPIVITTIDCRAAVFKDPKDPKDGLKSDGTKVSIIWTQLPDPERGPEILPRPDEGKL